MTTRRGRRCSAAVAHLKPALSRPNLELVTHALVEQVFEGATVRTVLGSADEAEAAWKAFVAEYPE